MHTCHVTGTVAILPLGQCNGFYMPVQCSLGWKHILVLVFNEVKALFYPGNGSIFPPVCLLPLIYILD